MKEEILRLHKEGKTYNEICSLLNCSKSTVSYHCGNNQKEKSKIRRRKSRIENTLSAKVSAFKNKRVKDKIRDFQRRNGSKLDNSSICNFTVNDVKNKIGNNPICYLTGEPIDLSDTKSFSFDHIIPATRGGSNELDNLEIINSKINLMKSDLTIEEFFSNCKKVLEYNGYKVEKNLSL